MATKVVIGDFTGSQMAAVDVDAPVGLIDHVGEGRINTAFAARTVVIEGVNPFTALQEGALPPGHDVRRDHWRAFRHTDGQRRVSVQDHRQRRRQSRCFEELHARHRRRRCRALPPASLLDTVVSPVGAGTTTGDGSYDVGANATVTASAVPGFSFLNWTDNGKIVSTNTSHTLAHGCEPLPRGQFRARCRAVVSHDECRARRRRTTTGTGMVDDGTSVTVVATANAGYTFTHWTEGGLVVSNTASFTFMATADRNLVANFAPMRTISVSAGPGGTATGGGTVADGSSVTVTATPNAGYIFMSWTEGGVPVCGGSFPHVQRDCEPHAGGTFPAHWAAGRKDHSWSTQPHRLSSAAVSPARAISHPEPASRCTLSTTPATHSPNGPKVVSRSAR
jgi:hypothetical protein